MSRKEITLHQPNMRVLIVDDHPATREGLSVCIARHAGFEVCGEAADVAEALQLVASLNPDIVVIDLSLKTGNGIDLIKRIRGRDASVRMLVWSMHGESHYAERSLRAGALGYVNKDQPTAEVVSAIQRVLAGKVYLSEPMAEQLLRRAIGSGRDGVEPPAIESLSDRELEAFQLTGQGLETHRIAEKMHISPKTVETYRARIKEKLGIGSGTELIWRAVQWMEEKRPS